MNHFNRNFFENPENRRELINFVGKHRIPGFRETFKVNPPEEIQKLLEGYFRSFFMNREEIDAYISKNDLEAFCHYQKFNNINEYLNLTYSNEHWNINSIVSFIVDTPNKRIIPINDNILEGKWDSSMFEFNLHMGILTVFIKYAYWLNKPFGKTLEIDNYAVRFDIRTDTIIIETSRIEKE